MNSKSVKKFIKKFDFLGPSPSIKIFNEDNFKSFKSSIISIIGIMLIMAFSIYSLIDYLKFDNPTIVYWKDNTQSKNITINLSDILLMVQLNNSHTLNLQETSVELEVKIIDQYDITSMQNISLEKCKLGKNIDLKHQESIEKYESARKQKYTDYYCIKKEDSDITIFNDQTIGEKYIAITVTALENFTLSPNDIYLRYVVESDSINHFDKNKPFKPNYVFGESISFVESALIYTVINVNYIEYETDNGIFFSNNKIYKGMEFYSQDDKMLIDYIDFYESLEIKKKALMGALILRINEKSFERYKRSYPKLQSLVADVIGIIQLILLIYEFLTSNLYSKKIGIKIVKGILKKKK